MNALARLVDRLHADTDTAAVAAGWTVTRTRWGGRSYGWTIPTAATTTGAPVADVIDLSTYRSTRATRSTAATFGGAA